MKYQIDWLVSYLLQRNTITEVAKSVRLVTELVTKQHGYESKNTRLKYLGLQSA